MSKPHSPLDSPPVYKRILLKISGEGFCPEAGFGIEASQLEDIARECIGVAQMGVQLAVVVGGGNFIRGATFAEDGHIPRATADYMGMLAHGAERPGAAGDHGAIRSAHTGDVGLEHP